ncbi:hypothetical protein BS50DRAFT_486492 [Corynespora cassiicola Philippines]|uniref:Fatty acid hydroxylase domain-containing protein n=1 Tax=Corynespora cassiicola Philippines TaxID=1448308 RepID=A0A2T2P0E9_CORCC|nr:hypothetical protein BS50DRAFT_486492 [Corynespora cassiicola Philippines]
MDIVLELFDTFLFDPIYATVLPRSSYAGPANATFSSIKEAPTAAPLSTWEYEPSTKYFSIQPGEFAYMSQWNRDDWRRQLLSLFIITWIFGLLVYFIVATISYVFIFDKATFAHPKYLKNQVRQEIRQASWALPGMAVLTAPVFLAEVRGYTKLYDTLDEAPFWWYNVLAFPFFLVFTDFCIYWIHRGLHHPMVYKRLHKPHHKWIMPTPYASHAFHPVDGYLQSVPYHVFPFLFPLQKIASVFLFAFINIWTVAIHDGEYVADNPVINGAACHTMHHLYFNYNYGQYTTLWDRLGGSYRKPNDELFKKELKMCKDQWEQQTAEMEKIQHEVEGDDDREYAPEEPKKVR